MSEQSNVMLKWSKYNHDWPIDEKNSLVFNSIANTMVCLETAFLQTIRTGEVEKSEMVQELYENGILVEEGETDRAIFVLQKRKYETNLMAFWLYTTMDCNFDCSYCYQQDLCGKDVYMTEETVTQVLDWAKKKVAESRPQAVEITFMGGEPLLHLPILAKLAEGFQTLHRDTSFSIITNGSLLTNETLAILKEHRVHTLQITLDGPAEIHDRRRYYKNGAPSFQHILQNILNIVFNWGSDFEINLRMNIDEENIDFLPAFLKELKQFQLNRCLILTIGDTIFKSEKGTGHTKRLQKKILQFYETAKQEGFVIKFTEVAPCWIGSDQWQMIAPNGDVYKCPSFVGMQEFAVGHVRDLQPNVNFYRQSNLDQWKHCLDCSFVGICTGGCVYRNFLLTGQLTDRKYCRKDYVEQVIRATYTDQYFMMINNEQEGNQ